MDLVTRDVRTLGWSRGTSGLVFLVNSGGKAGTRGTQAEARLPSVDQKQFHNAPRSLVRVTPSATMAGSSRDVTHISHRRTEQRMICPHHLKLGRRRADDARLPLPNPTPIFAL
jgi:hypothetical protein